MILHQPRQRPQNWSTLVRGSKHGWMVPFITFEWMSEWGAYLLSNWRFLEVLERLGSFSVLAAVIFYFSDGTTRHGRSSTPRKVKAAAEAASKPCRS